MAGSLVWSPKEITMLPIQYKVAKEFFTLWHYSKTCPKSDSIRLGFYRDESLVGVVTFGRGTNQWIGKALFKSDSKLWDVIELTRCAAAGHMGKNFTSHIVASALRIIETDVVVSYADSNWGHIGTIYQATNFLYTGMTCADYCYQSPDGHLVHKSKFRKRGRSQSEKELAAAAGYQRVTLKGKHRYIYVVNKKERKAIVGGLRWKVCEFPKKAQGLPQNF